MTLCMAAIAYDYDTDEEAILLCADERAEVGWAGGNVAHKFAWATKNWAVLIAGELSKAQDLVATCRSVLDFEEIEPLTRENFIDMFNEVSSVHKEKLCRRYVRQRFGIDFDRFLNEGESALPTDVRARAFHELGQLEFGCEMLFLGFTTVTESNGEVNSHARIVEIDRYGDVISHQSFGAIGTGSVIAKSTLYQREQHSYRPMEATLYHLYEAARLAAETAPGVGQIRQFYIMSPPTKERKNTPLSYFTEDSLQVMNEIFEQVGPKPVPDIPIAEASWVKEIQIKWKESESPSDSQTSEGLP